MRQNLTCHDRETAKKIASLRTALHPEEPWVTVDGPGDGEVTVMTMREAVDNEFSYTWEE